MDFFKANDVLKGLRVSAAPTEAEKTALRRDKLEACKIVVDHLFTPQVMYVAFSFFPFTIHNPLFSHFFSQTHTITHQLQILFLPPQL